MKTGISFFTAAMLLASAGTGLAEVHYVDVDSTNATPPYTGWATAATNIQDAVDAAVAGEEIVVTNGIYAIGGRAINATTTNRVAVDKPLTLRSVNGPQSTTIHGGGLVRCVYLTNGASLSGFTLTNGHVSAQGAGVFCESQTAVVSNCVVSANWAGQEPWDEHTFPAGGGAFGGTLNNCVLNGNQAVSVLRRSNPYLFFGTGGGAAACALNNCIVTDNFATSGGGAIQCTLNNCTLTGNSVPRGGFHSPGGFGGGASGSTLRNCIIYGNSGAVGANYDSSSILNYSCTTPLPTNGVGNITNEPAFVNPAAGNYRLRPDSPCIDAGTNLSAIITNDLDGRPRPLDGNGDGLAAFDMGAYEYRTPLLVWQDSPNPNAPHADWASAAHTIQDAVDAAVAGDEIVVTNGIYADGVRWETRVWVDKPLCLQSVSGAELTFIDGGQSNRCVSLTNGASLSGFTLRNGTAGRGAGALGGTLNNCVLNNNWAHDTPLKPLPIAGNGGGAVECTLNHCTLSGNGASSYGGGASECMLNNCTLTGNSVGWESNTTARGGGASGCSLNNCTLSENVSRFWGGGAYGCTLNNCTLVGNHATSVNESVGGGAFGCILNNCIVYFNTATQGANYSGIAVNYSCTTPLPESGFGNITNAPLFVHQASGNLRLQSNSPCINAGNNAFVPVSLDLDGKPRIVGYTVDIGAYEFQSPTSIISYAWLQQYALPTDGSADTADPDGDRMNNWQEWRCGTDPTNALSALRLLAPTVAGSDLTVRWESVAGVNYFLERCPTLGTPPTFTPLATNLAGQPGTTTFTVTNAVESGLFFYRVGVR